MRHSSSRRLFLKTAAAIPLVVACPSRADEKNAALLATAQFEKLESTLNGRLGVYVINTANSAQLGYRAKERFPMCSTFKAMVAAAILDRSVDAPGLLQRLIRYQQADLESYAPITSQHMASGMTVAELCAAAIQYSDNTAANLLIKTLGGPQVVTAFARSIDDSEFRLDRWEPALNTAIPGDLRDTTTPEAMALSLQRLVLGDALPPLPRAQLLAWLCGNTTGAASIKAGIPAGWKIGDKTGSGSYGTANDIAVLWPPERKPAVVAIYTTQHDKDAKARYDVIATAAHIVADWLG